ncbi:hypothetical protein BT96DRAFT_948592 [Gymnopus androsaceus JB14]|uniref:Uncharacterized protein n=1 Tax=Gymnopus androsaceus JB14 TaxID=1447944 RepID=A0A6A4GPJ0_9AGAR|nr:hypothetical protein BT96DRAFT_948592 [Gymnopus androsaceus JB14]
MTIPTEKRISRTEYPGVTVTMTVLWKRQALKSHDIKAMDHSDDPEAHLSAQAQERLRESQRTSEAESRAERSVRTQAWSKLQRECEKQKAESVPLHPANHVSPMEVMLTKWEKKAADIEEQCKQCPRTYNNPRESHSYSSKSRHSRPRNSDPRPQKKAHLRSPSFASTSNQPSSSNVNVEDSLFQDMHTAYDWSDEDEDNPDPHANKATPQQKAMVRKGLTDWAKLKGFESKSAKRNCKRKERKARHALTGLPPVPSALPASPTVPAAPPAPPPVPLAAPPAPSAPTASALL